MDNQILVNKLHNYISKQSKRNKHFNLAMLLDDDPARFDGHYSLLVSSKWLDNKSPRQATNEIMNDIIQEVGINSNEFKMISRVSVIKTVDPFVQMLTSAFQVCNSALTINNCNINGMVIEKGTLLESHHPNLEITPVCKKTEMKKRTAGARTTKKM
jgi:hypothetical protein